LAVTPGLSHSLKEKSPKASDWENEGAVQLVLLFLAIGLGNSIQTFTDSVNEMNRFTIQLNNKIIVVLGLWKSIIFQHVQE
jgi:hypothetical protein